jgi:hypothetical protein
MPDGAPGDDARREVNPTDSPDETSHEEVIRARGHEHVTAAHASTFEVTTDDWLTPAGDCIVGVEADRAPASFDAAFCEACRDPDARIRIHLRTTDHEATVTAAGHPELTFESDRSAVVRTSTHVDDRTVAVRADGAAGDLDRDLVDALVDGDTLTATFVVTPPSEASETHR